MQVLATHHIAITTHDVGKLEAFYTEKLGFAVTKRWEAVGNVFVNVGSTQLELIPKGATPGEPGPRELGQGIGINHIAIHVTSTDAAFAELKEQGVTILREPRDFQDVRIAFFTDPDGNVLELVEELGHGAAG